MASISADSTSGNTVSSFIAHWTLGTNSTTVTVFYGLTDGGTTPASWDNSISAGTRNIGSFSTTVSPLSNAETIYYWTVRGVDGGGTAWGSTVVTGTLGILAVCEARSGMVAESGLRSYNNGADAFYLDSRWGEGIVRQKLGSAHFTSTNIIPLYGVGQSTVVSTIDQGAGGTLGINTTMGWSWSSTDGRTSGYAPTGGSIPELGFAGNLFWPICPQNVNGAPDAVDGNFWILKKGAYKIDLSVNINAGVSNASFVTNSFTISVYAFPYEANRPKHTTQFNNSNMIFYSYTISGGGDVRSIKTFLRSTGWWRVYLSTSIAPNTLPPFTRIAAITVSMARS